MNPQGHSTRYLLYRVHLHVLHFSEDGIGLNRVIDQYLPPGTIETAAQTKNEMRTTNTKSRLPPRTRIMIKTTFYVWFLKETETVQKQPRIFPALTEVIAYLI